MNELQVLLLQADQSANSSLAGRLRAGNHLVTLAADSDSALQAILIRQFDVCVVGPGLRQTEVQEFVSALGEIAAGAGESTRTPIFVYAPADDASESFVGIDGFLPAEFNDSHFLSVVAAATEKEQSGSSKTGADVGEILPALDAEAFEEQCVGDHGLMAELIDLFAEERDQELPEMQEALAARDWQRLYRLAHTLKGSLATLHAPRARQRALELETAARANDEPLSSSVLKDLEAEVVDLTAALEAFRRAYLHL